MGSLERGGRSGGDPFGACGGFDWFMVCKCAFIPVDELHKGFLGCAFIHVALKHLNVAHHFPQASLWLCVCVCVF